MSTNTPATVDAVRSQSPHEAAVARYLAEHPHEPMTARAVAEATGISPRTASKALAALAAAGTATRAQGPVEHGRKSADMWTLSPAPTEEIESPRTTADATSDAPVSGVSAASADLRVLIVAQFLAAHPVGVTVADLASASGLRSVVLGRVLTAMEYADAARRVTTDDGTETWVAGETDPATVDLADVPTHSVCPTCGHRARIRPATARRQASAPGVNGDGQPKLRKGELRAMVAEFVTARRPGHEFTAGDIARELRRSPGAVQNCLGQLLAAGTIGYADPDARKVTAKQPVPANTEA